MPTIRWCSRITTRTYLIEGKNFSEAIDVIRKSASTTTPLEFAELHTLACLYAETEKPVEARQVILQAMDSVGMDEPNDAVWYVFGRIAEDYDLPDTARDYYKRVARPKEETQILLSSYSLATRRLAALNH